jgi:hypothetical protein
MSDYRIDCAAAGEKTAIILSDGGLFGFPKWRCVDGPAVWGSPSSGTCLSPRLTAGEIELSLGSVISGWQPTLGATGSGYRLESHGGTFPASDFEWEIVEID